MRRVISSLSCSWLGPPVPRPSALRNARAVNSTLVSRGYPAPLRFSCGLRKPLFVDNFFSQVFELRPTWHDLDRHQVIRLNLPRLECSDPHQHTQGGSGLGREQAAARAGGRRGRAIQGAAVRCSARPQQIRRFAPRSAARGDVLCLGLTGSHWLRGDSLIVQENSTQPSNWISFCRQKRHWAGS
jgi:hypothetical protein